jgi:hypothetical protein
VTEQVLSVLRKPPAPADALINSEMVDRAHRQFNYRPGIGYQVTDIGRMMDSLTLVFRQAFSVGFMQAARHDPDAQALLNKLIDIAPTRKEMRGMFDVGGSHMYVSEHGLVMDGFVVLPPAAE